MGLGAMSLGAAGAFGLALSKLSPLPDDSEVHRVDVLSYVYSNINDSIMTPVTAPVGAVGVADDVIDRDHLLHVKLCFADASMVADGDTIDSVWSKHGAEAWLFMHDVFLPLYDVGDSKYFVSLAVQQMALGDGYRVCDTCFVMDGSNAEVVDGCLYDAETGLAYIPKSLFDDSEYFGVEMQAMISLDMSNGLPEVHVPVYFEHDPDLVIEVTAPIVEQVISIDLTQVGISGVSAEDVTVSFLGGLDGHRVNGSSIRVSDDGNVLSIFMPLVCVCGLVINIPQNFVLEAILPTKAFALAAGPETMVTWPYGTLKHDGTISVGTTFSYQSYGYYPDRHGKPDTWYNEVLPAYELLHSCAYWYIRGPHEAGSDWYDAGDANMFTWEEIQDRVVAGAHGNLFKDVATGYTPGDGMLWIEDVKSQTKNMPTEHVNATYWGQMMVVPGAPGTSNYTVGTLDWWGSMVSGWPSDFPNSIGWSTAYCLHASQWSVEGEFFHTRVNGKVLYDGTETVDGVERHFYVISLTSEEISRVGGDNNNIQGCTVIYKVACDPDAGFVKLHKVFDK